MLVKDGIIVVGPVVNLAAAAAANAQVVFTIPAGQLVGTKSVRIKRVQLFNNGAGNDEVLIGTGVGAAFVALIPALFSANNLDDLYTPNEAEAFANITAYPDALPGGGTIDIQLTVEIIG